MFTAYSFLTFTILFTVLGNITGKFWADRRGLIWAAITLAAYIASTFTYIWSLRFAKFTILNSLFYTAVPILTILFGIFYFKEKVTAQETVGIVIALIGMVLITTASGTPR